jgi:hypothetical protein
MKNSLRKKKEVEKEIVEDAEALGFVNEADEDDTIVEEYRPERAITSSHRHKI